MICPSRTPSQVLEVSRRIAAELAAEALDPGADLTAADRRALVTLASAVDAAAVRRVGSSAPPAFPSDHEKGLAEIETLGGP